MKIKTIEAMEEELRSWDLAAQLPKEVGAFKLEQSFFKNGLEFVVARYQGPEERSLEICYTQETGDYVAVKNVGLFRFRDDCSYSVDREVFLARLLLHLTALIGEISPEVTHVYPYSAENLHFDKWQSWAKFPREYNGFRLRITPENPLKYLNGSYVLFAYEDGQQGHQLAIFYNEYRNEVFGELKRAQVFEYTDKFDLVFDDNRHGRKPGLFLQELETKISTNLLPVLDSF